MSGWDVMAGPLGVAVRVGLVLFLLLRVRSAVGRSRARSRRAQSSPAAAPTRQVSDSSIVSAYNDALLSGWPAGELATFAEVAERVATSAEHVRTVIARHWAV